MNERPPVMYIMTNEQQMRYLTQRMGEGELAECARRGEERALEMLRESIEERADE